MSRLSVFLSMFVTMFGTIAVSDSSLPVAEPQLLIEEIEGSLRIEAVVLGHGDGEISAQLIIERLSDSGTINSTQSRVVQSRAGSRDTVAQLQLSFDTGSMLTAVLTLELDGVEIARTVANWPEAYEGQE